MARLRATPGNIPNSPERPRDAPSGGLAQSIPVRYCRGVKDPRLVPMMTKVSRLEAVAVVQLAKQRKITKSRFIREAIVAALRKAA